MMSKLARLKNRYTFFLVILLLVGLGGIYFASFSKTTTPTVSANKTESQKISLEQSFELPNSADSKQLTQPLKITFQNAQLTNRIMISQKPQYAKNGTRYLMLNLLIENSNQQRIVLRSKDLIRLIDPNEKKFAPSLFNKDLEIDPDAVKKDVVGFLVPEEMKEFKIQYGAPVGDKQVLELKFN